MNISTNSAFLPNWWQRWDLKPAISLSPASNVQHLEDPIKTKLWGGSIRQTEDKSEDLEKTTATKRLREFEGKIYFKIFSVLKKKLRNKSCFSNSGQPAIWIRRENLTSSEEKNYLKKNSILWEFYLWRKSSKSKTLFENFGKTHLL